MGWWQHFSYWLLFHTSKHFPLLQTLLLGENWALCSYRRHLKLYVPFSQFKQNFWSKICSDLGICQLKYWLKQRGHKKREIKMIRSWVLITQPKVNKDCTILYLRNTARSHRHAPGYSKRLLNHSASCWGIDIEIYWKLKFSYDE